MYVAEEVRLEAGASQQISAYLLVTFRQKRSQDSSYLKNKYLPYSSRGREAGREGIEKHTCRLNAVCSRRRELASISPE